MLFLHAPLWTISWDSIVERWCVCVCMFSRNRASMLTSMTLSWRNMKSRNNNNHRTVLLQNFSPMSYTNSCLTFDALLWLQREKKKKKKILSLSLPQLFFALPFPFLFKVQLRSPFTHIFQIVWFCSLFFSLDSSLVLNFPLF